MSGCGSGRCGVRAAFLALTAATALMGGLLIGCGGAGGGSGTLVVSLADAPDPSITAINVTIDKVEAHVGGQWTTIAGAPQSFNLFDLVTNEALLGSANLPTGHYTQIRLFPSAATVTDSAGTHSVVIPSGVQTGVKLNLGYDIGPNEVTTILLDFNVAKSLIRQGNGQYRLQPVIPAVVKVLSGTVTGTVTDGSAPLAGASVQATYTAGDRYALGTEVNTSTSQGNGNFKLWALLPGTYTLTVTYTDPNTSAVRTMTRTNVVVAANQNTPVGDLVVP